MPHHHFAFLPLPPRPPIPPQPHSREFANVSSLSQAANRSLRRAGGVINEGDFGLRRWLGTVATCSVRSGSWKFGFLYESNF